MAQTEQEMRCQKLQEDIQRHRERAAELQQIIAHNSAASGAELMYYATEKKVCEDLVRELAALAQGQLRVTPSSMMQPYQGAVANASGGAESVDTGSQGDAGGKSKSKEIREQRKLQNPDLYYQKEKERKRKQRERKKNMGVE